MTSLAEHAEDYLRLRRALGFKLEHYGDCLANFAAYVDAAGTGTVTCELAVSWAWLPSRIKPITASYRISWVRGFARYLHAIDPAHEVPPPGLLAVPRRRPAPYLYSSEQVLGVLAKARRLRPPLRAATFETLFGLLAATGMRVGEALALTRDDVDLDEGMLTIRHAKFDRMRLVPLHPSVTAALRKYAAARDRRRRTRRTDRFFVSESGCAISRHTPEEVFAKITGQLGLRTQTVHPRIHDLRHTFAVRTLIDWQRDGTDVPAMLPVLSTYLGHVEPAKGSQTVFAGHRACGVCRRAGCCWPGWVAPAPVVGTMLHLTSRRAGVVVERDP